MKNYLSLQIINYYLFRSKGLVKYLLKKKIFKNLQKKVTLSNNRMFEL